MPDDSGTPGALMAAVTAQICRDYAFLVSNLIAGDPDAEAKFREALLIMRQANEIALRVGKELDGVTGNA